MADIGANRLTVYSSGSSRPIDTLTGPRSDLDSPAGLAINHSGQIAAAQAADNTITVYAQNLNGHSLPIAIISGAATHLDGPQYLAFAP